MYKITIALPAYNEEDIIYDNAIAVVKEIRRIEVELSVHIRLLIVDDGSNDGTREEVERAQREYPEINYQYKPGPSRRENLVKAMLEAETEYVGWMDSDLATPLKHLEKLIASSKYYDIVTGSRYMPSSRIDRRLTRYLISVSYNKLIHVMFGSKIADHWCGFKVFRREKLQLITEMIGLGNPRRQMFWDAQMWVCAQRHDMNILQIPVEWFEEGESALKIHTEIPMMLYTFEYWLSGEWRKTKDQRIPEKVAG